MNTTSCTFGDLIKGLGGVVPDWIEPHEWDNLNPSEQRYLLITQLKYSEVNRKGAEFANTITASLYDGETKKIETIYQHVFPEEAPWGPVDLGRGITCSPYQWDKLLKRIDELRQLAVHKKDTQPGGGV